MKNNLKNILMLSAVILIMSAADIMAVCTPTDCTRYGYTKTEADCSGMDTIRCPFDVTKVMCKKAPTICKVGDIYYSDETCSTNVVSGKTPIGVVGYIEDGGTSGLVLALDETTKSWSNEYYDLPCIPLTYWNTFNPGTNQPDAKVAFGGKDNTECIVQRAGSSGAKYDAGTYCANYTYSGKTGWFLPSIGEAYNMMFLNKAQVNDTLNKIGKTQINNANDVYWSSSEYNAYYAWVIFPANGSLNTYNNSYFKDYRVLWGVRCVREF